MVRRVRDTLQIITIAKGTEERSFCFPAAYARPYYELLGKWLQENEDQV